MNSNHCLGGMGKNLARIILVSAILLPSEVYAAASCSLSLTPVSFGVYRFTDPPITTTGNIQVTCQDPVGPSIVSYAISLTTGYSGSYVSRKLYSGTAYLIYNLYADAAHNNIWGDGIQSGTVTVNDSYTVTPAPQSRNYPIYGSVVPNQPVSAGTYSDVISITLSY